MSPRFSRKILALVPVALLGSIVLAPTATAAPVVQNNQKAYTSLSSDVNWWMPVGNNSSSLTPVHGDVVITQDDAVIADKEIFGSLRIKANNVTVENVTVRGRDFGPRYSAPIVMAFDHEQKGAKFNNLTVNPDFPVVGMNGVQGGNFTLEDSDISNVTDGVVLAGDNILIKHNRIHDLNHYAYDPAQKDGSHDDGIQDEGGSNHLITANDITGAHNAAIMMTQNYALSKDVRVHQNWLGDGLVSLNTSEKGKGAYQNFQVTSNSFYPTQRAKGIAALITPTTRSASNITNNVWYRTNSPAKVSNAGS